MMVNSHTFYTEDQLKWTWTAWYVYKDMPQPIISVIADDEDDAKRKIAEQLSDKRGGFHRVRRYIMWDQCGQVTLPLSVYPELSAFS